MKALGHLGIVGTGPTTLFLLQHIAANAAQLDGSIASITLFEKTDLPGYGMPYHPETTDRFHLSNISSEEIPELPETLFDWLRARSDEELAAWGIERETLSPSGIYIRLALGEYFHAQYEILLQKLRDAGIPITEHTPCEIIDVVPGESDEPVAAVDQDGRSHAFDTLVLATGHEWGDEDRPQNGYFASPWPIRKILPDDGEVLNFSIGTLGASLSAFDVVSSLAHRHGSFEKGGLKYRPNNGTEDFKLFMHSAQGWLPHLQFEQVEPYRVIYRHTDRDTMLDLRDDEGRLRLGDYFDRVCRPALSRAFAKDGMDEMVRCLEESDFGLEEFVEVMSERHDYTDAFEGLRKELSEAGDAARHHRPVHWKEVLDDLIFSLNFHAALMPAEDHITLKKTLLPFLMNVIAAMPLPSARLLLALHEAGKLELVTGHAEVDEDEEQPGDIPVTVEDEGRSSQKHYGRFVDCSGQKPLEVDDYPFASLVAAGKIRAARAPFMDASRAAALVDEEDNLLIRNDEGVFLKIGGIDIDAAYRIVGEDGRPDERIHELVFSHTSGARPYSYGIQACNATAGVVVGAWLKALADDRSLDASPEGITEDYRSL